MKDAGHHPEAPPEGGANGIRDCRGPPTVYHMPPWRRSRGGVKRMPLLGHEVLHAGRCHALQVAAAQSQSCASHARRATRGQVATAEPRVRKLAVVRHVALPAGGLEPRKHYGGAEKRLFLKLKSGSRRTSRNLDDGQGIQMGRQRPHRQRVVWIEGQGVGQQGQL